MQNNNAISLLNTSQTAKYLGLSIGTLAVWRTTGRYELPFIKMGGKIMYRTTDLDKWMESRQKTSTE